MKNTIKILQKYWGHSSFRSSQKEIIDDVLSNKDVLALLPTGGGKSICYQVPALQKDGVCLVISPLISLMKDQMDNLNQMGIQALTIKSNSSVDEIVRLFDNLKFGNAKFLYLSPERLQSEFILQKIKEAPINLIAVDEAHCISEWGHDFRPSYRQIKNVRGILPEINLIALTATATKKVIDDIIENLDLKNVRVHKKSFSKKNIAYQVINTENKLGKLERIIKNNPYPTIVYTNTRRKSEDISNFLNTKGYASTFYHGGMSLSEKSIAFDLWMKEKKLIMIATNAFGMGIDKANVKVVVHLDLPNSIENYIQEAGRAGRNGEKSFSFVLQNKNDIISYQKKFLEKIPTIKDIKEVHQKLYQYFHVAKGEYIKTPFDYNFHHFCNTYQLDQKKTMTILQVLKKNGIIEINDTFYQKSKILFKLSSNQLVSYKFNSELSIKLIDSILRTYNGVFQKETNINEFDLAKKVQTSSSRIIKELEKLDEMDILKYMTTKEDKELIFLYPREDDKTINRVSKTILNYLEQKKIKAQELINFIENDKVCRNIQILNYFGEDSSSVCHMCDVCLSQNKNISENLEQKIMSLFKKNKEISMDEIMTILNTDESSIIFHIRSLLSKDRIGISNQNKYFLL